MARYIVLRNPKEINSKRVLKEITYHMRDCKASEILLQLFFVGNDEVITSIMNDFRKIKNHIAFSKDVASGRFK